jgi:hypothetical protein
VVVADTGLVDCPQRRRLLGVSSSERANSSDMEGMLERKSGTLG